LTWKPNTPSARKEINSMPSPFGEGQTDTPINHHNLGEVLFPPPFGFDFINYRNFRYNENTRAINV
jgi:hypothetical protein